MNMPTILRPSSYARLISSMAIATTLFTTLGLSGCDTAPKTPIQTSIPTVEKAREPVIAFALGGGGAKGFSHIGAIKMLEANGIHASIVTGTSAGSFVGSLYASGLTPSQLQTIATTVEESDLADLTFSTKGFIKGQKLQDYVNKQVGNKSIQQFPKRFAAVATRLDNGAKTIFTSGNAGQAVRASCSIPNVFLPAEIGKVKYVDGGLVSPIPVSAARQMGAEIVIAIDISARPKSASKMNMFGIMDQTLNIMALGQIDSELAQASVVIKPIVGHIGVLDLSKRNEAVLEGEKAAMLQMAAVKAAIAQFKASPAALAPPPQPSIR